MLPVIAKGDYDNVVLAKQKVLSVFKIQTRWSEHFSFESGHVEQLAKCLKEDSVTVISVTLYHC